MRSSLAFIFPGQGSQKIGMLSEISAQEPVVLDTFAEASEVLSYDLWALAQNGPQEQLNLTERTQPVLLTASVALWRVWRQRGGAVPALMAGHSLGEFSALVCAESLEFADAVRLVQARGRAMQTAVPVGEGAMAAVLGMEDDQLLAICHAASAEGGVVEAVNFNAPGQVVIAGTVAAVDRAVASCKAASKKAMPLPVSAPFHTSLMRPAGDVLREAMASIGFRPPVVPVVHNVHGRPETDPERIKAVLFEQIFSPVKWTGCVEHMRAQGVAELVECGPGKVLSGLNKRIDKSLQSFNIEEVGGLEQSLAALG